MNLVDEILRFDTDLDFLGSQITALGPIEVNTANAKDIFVAEALAFRMFRATERFLRAVFLDSCVSNTTARGTPINSKLKCPSHEIAEEILKAGSRYLDWGNTKTVRELSQLVLENGFPVGEVLNPTNSILLDLQRIRNFIAHDSNEAAAGFEKVIANHLYPSPNLPKSAGLFLLSRRSAQDHQVIRALYSRIETLTSIYLEL